MLKIGDEGGAFKMYDEAVSSNSGEGGHMWACFRGMMNRNRHMRSLSNIRYDERERHTRGRVEDM